MHTSRRKGVTVVLACCGWSTHFLDAKKGTFRRKRMTLVQRVAAKKCTFIGKIGGEKAHIPKERCDFASCLLR